MKRSSTILGIGHDLVDIPDIEQQLAASGSRFSELFSVRERRQAQRKAQAHADSSERHLAACWAGKECVVKAWTEALGNRDFPLGLDEFAWDQIEILTNSKGCPAVILSSAYSDILADSLGNGIAEEVAANRLCLVWKISLTHADTLASGVALLCLEESQSI